MSARLKKICSDMEKTAAKISELQEKYKELGRQKTEQENTEIVELVRSIEVTPEELAEMLATMRGKGNAKKQPKQEDLHVEDEVENI